MIDWSCSNCGGKPTLISRISHDGWHTYDHGLVEHGVNVRKELVHLCSIDCVIDYLIGQQFAARAVQLQDEELARKVDEIEDQVEDR